MRKALHLCVDVIESANKCAHMTTIRVIARRRFCKRISETRRLIHMPTTSSPERDHHSRHNNTTDDYVFWHPSGSVHHQAAMILA